MHLVGKGSIDKPRKIGLITTQMLNEHCTSSALTSSKNADSRGGSKMSLYTDNYDNKTAYEEGRKMISQGSADVLTDTNINLFGRDTIPAEVHANNRQNNGKKSFTSAQAA